MTVKQTEATAQTSQKDQQGQSREESQGVPQAVAGQPSQTQRDAAGKEDQSADNRPARRDLSAAFISPFALLQRFFNDDLVTLFSDVGRQPNRLAAQARGGETAQRQGAGGNVIAWAPRVDVVQRGNELVVRADLPGMRPDDVTVEISDDAITISGERQEERSEEHNGVYRYERTYGSFFREIPLPEGALVDGAKANFKDGVLEIIVPAPPEQVSRGRRLEISRGDQADAKDANPGR